MIDLDLPLTLTASASDDWQCLQQEEPALEIALPQIFEQPPLKILQRGKLSNIEALVASIHRSHTNNPEAPLGRDYQELVNEFQPLFAWTSACWDYLLSTHGCRFVARNTHQKLGVRGDYRAVTEKDYSRLVHGLFRQGVLEFAQQPEEPSLSQWLRTHLWTQILEAYRRMDQPSDPRQRVLTPYSYLRCVPYRFLNDFHEELVHATVRQLPEKICRALDVYFLQFHTESASSQVIGCSLEECRDRLRQGLLSLLLDHRLVYCLLRQIERY